MIKKAVLEELYVARGMSMMEVAKELSLSFYSVEWWMRKHGIERRNRSDANYLKYNKNGDPFKIKNLSTLDEAILYGLGVGLFWGEGNKVSKSTLRVGNGDPQLIKCFVKFLREICGVSEHKIRFGLQLFNDSDEIKALGYWMNHLDVSRDRFHKTVSKISPQGKGTYRKKNIYGVVTIYVNNIKLVDWMHQQVKAVAKMPR